MNGNVHCRQAEICSKSSDPKRGENNEHKNRKARVEYENKTKEMPLFTEFGSIKRAFGNINSRGAPLNPFPPPLVSCSLLFVFSIFSLHP